MRKKILLLAAILFVVVASVNGNVKNHKVVVNHKGKLLEVSGNAIGAHKGHGDVLMVFVPELDRFLTEEEYLNYLFALEKDYEEVGAESADVEGEEDEEEY